ncbi:lysophospholipid acyltransferase family protein [Tellurirhabdus bombi]|uniref:hypothetical protein n=1 Tax=Tellurirhabdus bombi TaxID=2907205 RepID=UPI001F32E345|nr:hypothetical protein [Tellurirhabdus bombi]
MKRFVQQYRKELGLCRQRFEALDLTQEKGYLFKFTTFSANLQNVLPEIPREKHEALFQELLLQQIYTTFDQQFITANDLIKVTGPAKEIMAKQKVNIYCTFHLGSYRLLTSYLYRNGVNCALMIGSRAYQEQGASIMDTIQRLQQKHNLTNTFRLLDAEQTSSTLQVLRELRAGTSLIIYLDGLTSTTGINRKEDKELQVRLGQQQVWARKGVGFLSHISQVPIVPVFSYRNKDLSNVLAFEEPIDASNFPDREDYCQHSLQSVYNHFSIYLKKYPAQWEGWTYIHSFLDAQQLEQVTTVPSYQAKNSRRVAFNQERYAICDLDEAPILFDRRLYVTYEITPDLRDFLLQLSSIASPEDVLGSDMYQDLLSKQIIA